MAYYLLMVEQSGTRSYREAGSSKHQINARSADDAKYQADEIMDNHYPKARGAQLRLFDESGLVASRTSEGEWQG